MSINTLKVASVAIAACALALPITVTPLHAIDGRQAPAKIPTPVLERYVGEYVYPDGSVVWVRLKGDTLVRDLPGQQAPYVPLSETLFRIGPIFTAEFVIDQAGGVTQIISDGVGVELRLRRKGSPPPPRVAPGPAVRVPRSVLERYVGTYEFIKGQMSRTDLRIVVHLKGDTLVREMGQQQILTPISETRFRVAGTSLMVDFVVDEAGVTQVLGSGGQQMLARLMPKR
jgi:hypothetical protein